MDLNIIATLFFMDRTQQLLLLSNKINLSIQSFLIREKFSIKNIPEITVGGFLQNKDVQSQYLSYIKPKTKEEQNLNIEKDQLPKVEEKIIDINSASNKNISNNQTNQSPAFNTGTTYNYSTVTNFNINNYNFNQNIPSSAATPSIPSNLSLFNNNNNLQTISKISKPPVLNNSFLNPQPQNNASKPIPATLQELHYHKNVNLANMNSNNRFVVGNIAAEETTITTEKEIKKKETTINGELPDTLKQYIEKSFNKCRTEEERKKCGKILQKIITSSQKKDQLFSRSWEKYPLPQLPWEIEENTKKSKN
jgi:hypothetical protein